MYLRFGFVDLSTFLKVFLDLHFFDLTVIASSSYSHFEICNYKLDTKLKPLDDQVRKEFVKHLHYGSSCQRIPYSIHK